MTADETVCFVDTETTGLDPDLHEIWEVGLIVDSAEYQWFLPVDLGRADPIALRIGRFHDRHPKGHDARGGDPYTTEVPWFASEFAALTRGRHLVGAVISFDEERLRRLLRANGACPEWHYHLVDVEALAAGWVAGRTPGTSGWGVVSPRPPWNSQELSKAVGVVPDDYDRHTALGDARWAKAIYEAVCRTADRADRAWAHRCPDCGMTIGHSEVCAGFDRNDPARYSGRGGEHDHAE